MNSQRFFVLTGGPGTGKTTTVRGLIQLLKARKHTFHLAAPTGRAAKRLSEATGAGVAFVPYDTGDKFPGVIGKDYLDRATESQSEVGEQAAEWLVKTLGGKGNIIMFGGTPGNPMTEAQTHGWRPVFAKHPGIKVLETEPVPVPDPAVRWRSLRIQAGG